MDSHNETKEEEILKGRDIHASLILTLEESCIGSMRDVGYQKTFVC